jgi:hypothetical protein
LAGWLLLVEPHEPLASGLQFGDSQGSNLCVQSRRRSGDGMTEALD